MGVRHGVALDPEPLAVSGVAGDAQPDEIAGFEFGEAVFGVVLAEEGMIEELLQLECGGAEVLNVRDAGDAFLAAVGSFATDEEVGG